MCTYLFSFLRKHCTVIISVIILFCLIAPSVLAELDKSLSEEIMAWRVGRRPPARLLKFPDGKIDTIGGCGMRMWGESVSDYFFGITNADLLEAVILDRQSEADSFHAASSRLIALKGSEYVAHLLAVKRKVDPSAFVRSDLAVLAQLLCSPYLAIQVACIAVEDMSLEQAEKVLQQMSLELKAGKRWDDTYRKFSELHPDLRGRAQNPRSVRTLISYLYDSTVSPSGFDILTYRNAENLPLEHLDNLFRAKSGTHVFRAESGVYLYHIRSFQNDSP
jgi:hypothetical protein